VDHGKRHVTKKRLFREPDHGVGILAERPQHRELLDAVKGLAQDVDAFAFELIEVVHIERRI
jgi:hypothetical protein